LTVTVSSEEHFHLDIQDTAFAFSVNEARVAAEAALDGLYVIRTSVAETDMSAEAAVLNYKRLAEVERAFRTLKGVDLQVRPIRHRLETRVKAHISLSMLAYYVQWHMGPKPPPQPPPRRWHAGAELRRPAHASGHGRAQYPAPHRRHARRRHVHAYHAAQCKAAAGPGPRCRHRRVDSAVPAVSIASD